jgi:uncharacterized metal-binding protein YceD (DUF177 family)
MTAPEFSRPVPVAELKPGPNALAIEANATERAALATRLGLDALKLLQADVVLTSLAGGHTVRLDAKLTAQVEQTCVVTLEPVASTIEGKFQRVFEAAAATPAAREVELDLEGEYPDPIVGGVIDVGETVAEQLALEIDPFPRASGATFAGFSTGPEREQRQKPFAVLAKLKEHGKSG